MARYIDSPDLYLRKGKKVRVNLYSDCKLEESYTGIIIDTPRLNGKFASVFDLVDRLNYVTVKVKCEDGRVLIENGSDCYSMRDPSELTYDDWMKLRDEIRLGSVFIGNYDNSFGVDSRMLCSMCDLYLEDVPESEDSAETFANFMLSLAPEWKGETN